MLHWEPFFGNFEIQFGIGQGALFEAFSKVGGTVSLDIVQHGLRDEAAAAAFASHSIKNLQCSIGKDDI